MKSRAGDLLITVRSYGIKHHPNIAVGDGFIDCRGLFNPHTVPHLRDLNGLNSAVHERVRTDPNYEKLLNDAIWWVSEEKLDTIHFYCHGGKHRSVVLAEEAAKRLQLLGETVTVEHLDVT